MILTARMLAIKHCNPKTTQDGIPRMRKMNPFRFLFPMSQSPVRIKAVPIQSIPSPHFQFDFAERRSSRGGDAFQESSGHPRILWGGA